MRRKCTIVGICTAALVLFLALGILPGVWSLRGSRYSRRVEEDSFSLGMERLNCTLAEAFPLHQGDAIDVCVVRASGELTISIGERDRAPVYAGRNPEPGAFWVTIPRDGDYVLSVSGKRAEGSVSLRIDREAGR